MLRITISCSLWRAASSPAWRSASLTVASRRPASSDHLSAIGEELGKGGQRAEITGPQVSDHRRGGAEGGGAAKLKPYRGSAIAVAVTSAVQAITDQRRIPASAATVIA
jgi:hypothetical protein